MIWARQASAVVAVVALVAMGCAASANRARPPAPTYAEASGTTTCAVVESRNEPFVVDWRADKRSDLDAALGKGVVIVAYDCKALRMLPDCAVAGSYTFAGVTEKEQLIRLGSSEELRANLPLSGGALVSRLGGSLERGASLDIALALIGKKTSTQNAVLRSELKGECTGATHFVRSATLGAFVMKTGTRARTQALADVFLASASAAGSSEEQVENRDGSLDACRRANATSDAPPAQCASPVKLELREIHDAPTAAPRVSDDEEAPRCPKGLVAFESGKCGKASSQEPYLCAFADPGDCETQCQRGSLASCAILGRSHQIGRGVPKNAERAAQLLARACEGGVAQGCGRLGEQLFVEKKIPEALRLLDRACTAGWFKACEEVGAIATAMPGAAKVDVFAMFKRACAGGDAEGCWSLGSLFNLGLGVRKNDLEAMRAYELACQGGAKLGCTSLATMIDTGRGTPSDPARAAALLRASCERGFSHACGALSSHYFTGRGVPRDPAAGIDALARACGGEDRGSCLTLAMRYTTGTGVPQNESKARELFTRACDGGIEPACTQVLKP